MVSIFCTCTKRDIEKVGIILLSSFMKNLLFCELLKTEMVESYQIIEEEFTANVKLKITEICYDLNRNPSYYRANVTETDNENYPTSGQLILGLNFTEGNLIAFTFFPYYREKLPSARLMVEQHRKAKFVKHDN